VASVLDMKELLSVLQFREIHWKERVQFGRRGIGPLLASAANGAIMRTAVLSMVYYHDLEELIASQGRWQRSPYRSPLRCILVAVNVAIALLMRGSQTSFKRASYRWRGSHKVLEEDVIYLVFAGNYLLFKRSYSSSLLYRSKRSKVGFWSQSWEKPNTIGYTL